MICNHQRWEQFEQDFIRNDRVDVRRNFRIFDELYREAVNLGVFTVDRRPIREDKLRYARAINCRTAH